MPATFDLLMGDHELLPEELLADAYGTTYDVKLHAWRVALHSAHLGGDDRILRLSCAGGPPRRRAGGLNT